MVAVDELEHTKGFPVIKNYSGSDNYYFWFYYETGLPGVR
jgi:hypothetical protein